MRTTLGLMLLCVSMLGGCECAYGGAGCGSPSAFGLCAPIVQVDVPTALEIVYGDDTGAHPAEVVVTRIADPALIGVWPGSSTGSLTVLGLAVGTSEVELDITGWQQRGLVQFSVTAEPAPACPVSEYGDPPSFDVALADE